MADKVAIEKRIFPETFLVLKVAGFWAPTTVKNRCLLMCYYFYTFFSFTGVLMLIITILIDQIISEEKNFMSTMEYWYMIAIYTNAIVKVSNLLIRRNEIINILRTSIFDERWTHLRDDEEIAIMKESEKGERNITRLWLAMLVFNYVSSALNPIVSENPENILMWECYTPCDRSIPICFWTCYAYQLFSYGISSIVHVGCDCLILNFIERLCAHVKLFKHRLKLLPNLVKRNLINTSKCENLYIKECAIDHQSIYNTARELTEMFNEVVFLQFLLSISVLCTNIYFLSKQDLFSAHFVAVFVYLCCAMVQNFFYCWYGYKLTQLTSDIPYIIFTMDWLILHKTSRKMLYFIMLSASHSMTLFNNFIVHLSPEMFLKMVKLSYSAFNLLQVKN